MATRVNTKTKKKPDVIFKVGCNNGIHSIALIDKKLVLLAHPDQEEDLALLAITGKSNGCKTNFEALAKNYRCYYILDLWRRWSIASLSRCTESEKRFLPYKVIEYRQKLVKTGTPNIAKVFDYIKDPTLIDFTTSVHGSQYLQDLNKHQKDQQLKAVSKIAEREIAKALLYNTKFNLASFCVVVEDLVELNSHNAPYYSYRSYKEELRTKQIYSASATSLTDSASSAPMVSYKINIQMDVINWALNIWKHKLTIVDGYLITSMRWPFWPRRYGIGTGYLVNDINLYQTYPEPKPYDIALTEDNGKWMAKLITKRFM